MEFAEAQYVWSNMHKTSRGSTLSGEQDGLDEDSLEVFQAAASEIANLGSAYGRVALQDSDAGAYPASKQGQDNSPGQKDPTIKNEGGEKTHEVLKAALKGISEWNQKRRTFTATCQRGLRHEDSNDSVVLKDVDEPVSVAGTATAQILASTQCAGAMKN